MIEHLCAITLGYLIDLIVGDPSSWPHPVRWIGSLIVRIEQTLNRGRHRKLKGVFMLLFVLMIVGIMTGTILSVIYQINTIAGVLLEAVIISTTISQKSLSKAAVSIYEPLLQGNLSDARNKVSYIVGRDTERLEESEVTRATVETVAENTSDGITAPLFWALIGGAPLAMIYRAVNTCDSMVGYKNEQFKAFGWASAKLDDVLNWIPSRMTAFLMIICNRPDCVNKREAWRILFRDARKHPSPNSGWLESAVAALLGVRLGGRNYYQGIVSERARMGESYIPLHSEHILKTNQIMRKVSFGFLLVLWIGGISIAMAISRF